MQDTVNCPILVGHLNNLTKRGGSHAELAKQLVMILDDVEGIAGLIDHEFPAERHAMSRASHIAESASRLQTIVVSLGTLAAIERDRIATKLTYKAAMTDGWFLHMAEDIAKDNVDRMCDIMGTKLSLCFTNGDHSYFADGRKINYGQWYMVLASFMAEVRANQKPLDVSAGPNWDKRHDQPVLGETEPERNTRLYGSEPFGAYAGERVNETEQESIAREWFPQSDADR